MQPGKMSLRDSTALKVPKARLDGDLSSLG